MAWGADHEFMMYQKKFICMDTIVTLQILSQHSTQQIDQVCRQAARLFYRIEHICSRFYPDSELMRLSRRAKETVTVSPFLYQALKIAVEVAGDTDGAFDPAIGRMMEKRGFNTDYISGKNLCSAFADGTQATYKDIVLSDEKSSVYLKKPMVIDLNALVKGMAVDLASEVLRDAGYEHFMINAGGDIYAAGQNNRNEPWKVGIRDPHDRKRWIGYVSLSDEAICTSGDYERTRPGIPGENHLLHPGTKRSPDEISSCSVIAPFAMLADAFSTAVMVMGKKRGLRKMEDMNLDCLIISRLSARHFTHTFKENRSWTEQEQAYHKSSE